MHLSFFELKKEELSLKCSFRCVCIQFVWVLKKILFPSLSHMYILFFFLPPLPRVFFFFISFFFPLWFYFVFLSFNFSAILSFASFFSLMSMCSCCFISFFFLLLFSSSSFSLFLEMVLSSFMCLYHYFSRVNPGH